MEKKVKSSKRKKRAAQHAHPDDRRAIRRRLIGAAAILALTLLFWEFGSTLPPQRVVREVPSEGAVFQQRGVSALSALVPKKLPGLDLPALIKEGEDITEEAEAEEEEVADEWIIGEKKEGAGAVGPQFFEGTEEEKEEAAATPQPTEAAEPVKPAESSEPAKAEEEKKEAEKPAPAPAPQAAAEKVAAKDPPPPPPPKKDPPAAKENTSGQDNYHVQVGAFGELLRAKETASYIEGEGYAVSLLPLEREGAPLLWQVRATGYPTRDAAEKVQQQLAPLGYPNAQIVKVDTAAATPAPKPKAEAAPAKEKAKADAKGASPRYILRVGAFSKGSNKDRAIAAMRKIGATASEESVTTKDGAELIRVFIADIETQEEAKRLQKALEKEGYKNTVIEKTP